MASVFERGGRWYLRIRNAAGRWVNRVCEARTKTEAKRLAVEAEQRSERQRMGLEALPPTDGGGTVAELLEWWLKTYSARSPSHARNVPVIKKHLLASGLAVVRLAELRAADVESFLHAKGTELGPQSVNHLRRFLLTAFNRAREVGRYEGPNPVEGVKRRRVPTTPRDYLRAEEVPAVLACVPRAWRSLFAAAVYTGLRKGELFALRKADVDLKARLLTVAHSHDRDTTKGGHADVIPIASELVPHLEQAIATSASELVFPDERGRMWPESLNLCRMLRQAMARAGIVTGYRHKCRKHGCGHVETAPDAATRRCPKHGPGSAPKLWPIPQVRPIRFHDLRHTTGSLLTMAGANPAAVQRILRHSDVRITMGTYGHLSQDYLRAEVDRLHFDITPPTAQEPARAIASSRFAALVLHDPESRRDAQRTGCTSTRDETGKSGDPNGTRTHVSGVRGQPDATHTIADVPKPSQPVDSIQGTDRATVQPLASVVPIPKKFAALVLHGGAEDLLTVRQVAKRLGVSTFTVYGLCDRGELKHVRISNAVRIAPADLATYLSKHRRS